MPDTDIARKTDRATAEGISRKAARVLERGGALTPEGRLAAEAFDAEVRDAARLYNPGTTADLMAASLFALLLSHWTPERIPDLLAGW